MEKKYNDDKIYSEIENWLLIFRTTNNNEEKTRVKTLIVTRMLPIVKRIAKTIARRSYDPIDDLVQAGSIGLLKAIDKYQPEKNQFKIYAGYCIIGEMRHYLRDKLNTIQVPRHIQELVFRINSFTSTLTVEELDEITDDYIAEMFNVPTDYIDFAITADRRRRTISLDDMYKLNDDNLNYEELISGDSDYEETEELEDAKLILKKSIDKLPDDCREIIKMYYYDDIQQIDIADKLNLTKMQVYRRIKKAFSLMYKDIKGIKIQPENA